ncbi:MAG: exodeoxyribonuclease VII large subunit [Candidatus Bipolaricaulota bacterium]
MNGGTDNKIDFGGKEVDPDDVYTISELNRRARTLLESNFDRIWVEGEISNLSIASSGHAYFTLKEESSEISAVMFSGDRRRADVDLEDGTAVLAQGTLTVYEKRGRYQLILRDVRDVGAGKLQMEFEKLKKRLGEEGLFDPEKKKEIPDFPRTIGVVTSPTGAAVRDIVSTIEDRYPLVTIYLFPVKVQGDGAGEGIAGAIDLANRTDAFELDILIVSRGGGSLEDLWPFNEEVVARAIYRSEIPVVSGVGHEIDFTISDFVADRRVPTPTAAGKEVVPDRTEIMNGVDKDVSRLRSTQASALHRYRDSIDQVTSSFAFRLPFRALEERWQEYDRWSQALGDKAGSIFDKKTEKFNNLLKRLSLANPTRLLNKGYSITETEKGEVLLDATEVERGESLKTSLFKGIIRSEVREVEGDGRRGQG